MDVRDHRHRSRVRRDLLLQHPTATATPVWLNIYLLLVALAILAYAVWGLTR